MIERVAVKEPTLTDDQREFIDRFLDVDNLENTFREFYKIRVKSGELVPFVLNATQKIILKSFQKAHKAKIPLRFIILKARQRGVSTFWEAVIHWLAITNDYFKATIVGHEADASNNLFEMCKRYHENLPPWLQLKKKKDNSKKLQFLDNHSVIDIQTAEGGEDVKRSDTTQAAHLTEVTRWRSAKSTLLALLQTVPKLPNTLIVIETTAKGIGGAFYNRWQVAYSGESALGEDEDINEYSGATDYTAIFISWIIDEEYTRPFKSPADKENFIKDIGNSQFNSYETEEQELLDKYGATLEHLNWRRHQITDECDGDIFMFHQEYPSHPTEAFVTSGRPKFDVKICNEWLGQCRELEKQGKIPIRRGDLVEVYDEANLEYKKLRDKGVDSYFDLRKYVHHVDFIDSPTGLYKIFGDISHVEGESYKFCAGADVSEGLEQGDFNCFKVLNRKNKQVVMTYHAHSDPDLLAVEQHKTSILLGNDCYFGTERNNHGLTTIMSAYKLGVDQYYSENFDKGYQIDTDIIGFRTTGGSRTPAINDLAEWIREEQFKDYEKEFWLECLTFVYNAKGKLQAQGKDKDPATKCFDDRIFAAMIMLRVHQWLPNYRYEPVVIMPAWVKEWKQRKHLRTTAMSG